MAGLGPRGSGFDSVESRLPNPEPRWLLANAEASNQLGVPIGVLALEIIQQAPPLADQLQQPAARMVILRVYLEVLGEVIDPVAENRDLHFRRSGVAVVRPVVSDDPGLAVLVQRHVSSSTNGPETHSPRSPRQRSHDKGANTFDPLLLTDARLCAP